MKLLAATGAIFGALTISGAASAACPAGPGDSPVISVPKGSQVRVMVSRPGSDYSNLEVCSRDGAAGDWRMEINRYVNLSGWLLVWTAYARPADWQLDFSEVAVDLATYAQRPWTGMRKTATASGYTLAWYGAPGPDKPNTVVEVCIYAHDISECPPHS